MMVYKDLYDFVSLSENSDDFLGRIHLFYGIMVTEFQIRVRTERILPHHIVKIVEEINSEVVKNIFKINHLKIVENQPKIDSKIFLKVIKINFPSLYSEYFYQKKIINN